MRRRNRRMPPALKHGGYSGITLLPGESRAAFEKLHNDLIAEFAPVGRLEKDVIATMARLIWRKQNLLTYRIAEEAQNRIVNHKNWLSDSPQEAAEEEIKTELGAASDLVEIGDVATTNYLLKELAIVDRLDGMIDRCLKRLLFVRGLKSISSSSATVSSPPRKPLAVA